MPNPEGHRRGQGAILAARLREPRRFLQVIAGPRQVGKTTLVRQVLEEWGSSATWASADEPTLRDRAWIEARWESARLLAPAPKTPVVLALDEIHKVPGWSETVKRLWDEDTAARRKLRVVLLGSAPLLLQRGLTESLAGRFEVIRLGHWSLAEMRAAFGWDFDRFVRYGGYPGAAPLTADPARWRRYVLDALIETTLSRDVLLLTRVDKPALLRRLFELGCRYSGQILSYTKMLGHLQDAGNSTTLAHYVHLLHAAGMLTGLPKFAGSAVRQRGSIPKLQVMNVALMNAQHDLLPDEALRDPDRSGRVVESAIGAHLANAAAAGECELFYWREKNHEVDFVAKAGRRIVAIEVKSGRRREALPGMAAFLRFCHGARPLLVGGDGIPVETFLEKTAMSWLAG